MRSITNYKFNCLVALCEALLLINFSARAPLKNTKARRASSAFLFYEIFILSQWAIGSSIQS